MSRRALCAALALLAATGVSACTSGDKQVPVDVNAPSASASPTPDESAQHLPSPPAPGSGLRSVDWQNILAPGYACFLSDSIQLISGFALVPSEQGQREPNSDGPRYVRLSLLNEPVYGELAGYGPAVAVTFSCTNNSGTADGALLYSVGVYGAQGDNPVFLSLLLPKNRPPGQMPTLVAPRFDAGRLVVGESFYGPQDKTCCPSKKASTTWTYSGGSLTSK